MFRNSVANVSIATITLTQKGEDGFYDTDVLFLQHHNIDKY